MVDEAPGDRAAAEKGDQAVALFDGESLSGWDCFTVDPNVKMEDVWSVQDGILVVSIEDHGIGIAPENIDRVFEKFHTLPSGGGSGHAKGTGLGLTITKGLIEQHGGHVAEYLGDGVVAYFGYPTADEAASLNAVRAGLALTEAVSSISTSSPPSGASTR